jgi:hypothetical protein
MVEWANEELAEFQAHVAFLKLGSARIFDCRKHAEQTDVTPQYIALIERHIEEWVALMSFHNIRVQHDVHTRRAA